jgi:uncharacterized membrane protein
MSYQERRAVVAFLSTILINAGYLAYMLPRQPVGDPYAPEVFRFWGEFFLVLIGVSIIVRIVIAILFSILNTIATQEREPGFEDERDRLIDLKSTRNGFFVFAIGFLLAMVALVMNMTPATMFLLMMVGGVASSIVSELSEFWFYRQGV